MNIGAAFRRLHARYPDGLYDGMVFPALVAVEHCTLHGVVRRRVERAMAWSDPKFQTPAFFSELWQFGWLLIAIVLLLARASWPLLLLLGYRAIEILIFSLHWALSPRPELKSITRSLMGFALNVVEIVIVFAAIYATSGCAGGQGKLAAIYESARTVVTIGPSGAAFASGKDAVVSCQVALLAQILLSYTVTVFIIASLVGRIRQKTGGGI